MKEPPDDDALWPSLILLFFTLLFTAGVLLMMWIAKQHIVFAPAPSTLPSLIADPLQPGTSGTP